MVGLSSRVRCRGSARPARAALPIRPRSAAWSFRGGLRRGQPGGRFPGMLDGWAVDGHRHRVRAGGARGHLHPPAGGALRTFLLTLAVVDDLRSSGDRGVLHRPSGAAAADRRAGADRRLPLFSWRRGYPKWWILVPLAVVAWALVHASGAIDGRRGAVGFSPYRCWVPRRRRNTVRAPDAAGVGRRFAVPVFAFFAAGVTVGGWAGIVGGDGVIP